LVVVYILGVLAAAALVLVLLFLLVSRLASAAVTPSGRSARDLEPLDVEAASLRNERLEAGESRSHEEERDQTSVAERGLAA
jgi:hypothetical protein